MTATDEHTQAKEFAWMRYDLDREQLESLTKEPKFVTLVGLYYQILFHLRDHHDVDDEQVNKGFYADFDVQTSNPQPWISSGLYALQAALDLYVKEIVGGEVEPRSVEEMDEERQRIEFGLRPW